MGIYRGWTPAVLDRRVRLNWISAYTEAASKNGEE